VDDMTDGPQVFGKREHALRAALRVVEEQDLGHAGSLSGRRCSKRPDGRTASRTALRLRSS
jgi:hypothetical protein